MRKLKARLGYKDHLDLTCQGQPSALIPLCDARPSGGPATWHTCPRGIRVTPKERTPGRLQALIQHTVSNTHRYATDHIIAEVNKAEYEAEDKMHFINIK
jgi:hypothetical protein